MHIPRTVGFVDGENLVMRYQAMVAAGWMPRKGVIHQADTFVWHPKVSQWSMFDFSRINYYTSTTGDAPKVEALRDFICDVEYAYAYTPDDDVPDGSNNLVPHVFHKPTKNAKARNVDLQISIDVLRTAHSPAADVIYILSGDGDYVPLIQEASRSGKTIWLAAFSSGLNPKLRHHVDTFQCLDDLFFLKKKAESET